MLGMIDYGLPLYIMKRLVSIRCLADDQLEHLMERAEKSGVIGAAAVMIIKVLIFPAFYGIGEIQDTIGYSPTFPVAEYFEHLKEGVQRKKPNCRKAAGCVTPPSGKAIFMSTSGICL